MIKSPVAIFCYKRPHHTRQVLLYLEKATGIEDTEVYFFCDGPKEDCTEKDREEIEEVRKEVNKFSKAQKCHFHFSEKNLGLNNSIENGIATVFKQHDRIIILEDDVIIANGFLTYMNKALDLYLESASVYHISGYTPATLLDSYPASTFFLKHYQIWGWGTWRSKWNLYYSDVKKNYETIISDKSNSEAYNFHASINYLDLLLKTVKGDQTIWDTKWSSSLFVNNKYGLYPFRSLSKNIGFDDSGIHCDVKAAHFFVPNHFHEKNDCLNFQLSDEIKEDKKIIRSMKNFLSKKMGRKYYYKQRLLQLLNLK